MPSRYQAIFHEDNQSMIRVIMTGKNPTMRHLDRVHRVAVATMHERLGDPETKDNVDVYYTKSDHMAADIYTKAFTDPTKWGEVCKLINIGEDIDKTGLIRESNARYEAMLSESTPATANKHKDHTQKPKPKAKSKPRSA